MTHTHPLAALIMSMLCSTPLAAQVVQLDAASAAQQAVEASTLVHAADARIAAQERAVAAADATRLPSITTSLGVARLSSIPELSVALGGPGTPPVTLFPSIETTASAVCSLSQPLYTGGAITNSREAARRELEARTDERTTQLSELRFQGRSAYWQAVAAAAQRDTATAQLHRAERLDRDVRALRQAGMAVDADVLSAEARLAAAEVAVIRAATTHRDALAQLRSQLGLHQTTELQLLESADDSLPTPPAPLPELAAHALASRSEIEAMEQRSAALAARAKVVASERLPSVMLSGAWELSRPNQRYLPLSEQWDDSWRVGVYASWKVFDGGQSSQAAASVREERRALEAHTQELERQIRLAVERARLALEASLQAVSAADAAEAAARARQAAVQHRYAAGLATISEILDADADLADAEVARVQARVATRLAQAGLQRAMGE